MQQHNAQLLALCHHLDIKASIFLSMVTVVLLAYAVGPFGNVVFFACSLVFAAAYPIRIGASMLIDRPPKVGENPSWARVNARFGRVPAKPGSQRAVRTLRRVIFYNTRLLDKKSTQNRHIILTTIMLFSCIMVLTGVGLAIVPPSLDVYPFA